MCEGKHYIYNNLHHIIIPIHMYYTIMLLVNLLAIIKKGLNKIIDKHNLQISNIYQNNCMILLIHFIIY